MDHGVAREVHIPRPPNAFILFRSQFIKNNHIPGNVEGNHSTLSKIIALCWKALPQNERQDWEQKARLAQAEHRVQYPDWRWKPEANTLGKKRPPRKRKRSADDDDDTDNTRQTKPKASDDDSRVAKIAELVKQGKTGVQLEHALGDWQRSAPSNPPPPPPPSTKKRRTRTQRRQTKSSSATSPSPVPPQPPPQPLDSPTQHVFLHSPSDSAPVPDPPRALNLVWEQTITPASYSPTTPDPSYWKSYTPLDSQDDLGYEDGLQFDQSYSQPFILSQNTQDDHRSSWSTPTVRHGFCSVPVVAESADLIPSSSTEYSPLPDTLYTNISLSPEIRPFISSTFSTLTGWAGDLSDYPSNSSSQLDWQIPAWNQ